MMMNEGDVNRIWQPNVRPTADCVPYPSLSDGQQQEGGRTFTKTSLHHHLNDSNQTQHQQEDYNRRVAALNRDILKASQSFNSSPKPFTRQTTLPQDFYATKSLRPRPPLVPNSQSFSQQEPTQETSPSSSSSSSRQPDKPDNMAPKLVHNLYNSPIDLYSMNNIRKTIEAHSEIIAPGVKGINFSKLDTPVNKQSEVYKLVMEEEQQQQQQQSAGPSLASSPSRAATRLSPISGQPMSLPSAFTGLQYAREQPSVGGHRLVVDRQQQVVGSNSASGVQMPNNNSSSSRPKCCECGQFIVGPFARLQNRHIHPHCFNCTTCGSSLKNCGYFTINDKLYCDIHAKQVANLMRINYNFDANCQTNQGATMNVDYHQQAANYNSSNLNQADQQHFREQQPASSLNNNNLSQATISTMFSSNIRARSMSGAHDDDHCVGEPRKQQQQQQIRWTWRPANGDHQQQVASTSATMQKVATTNEPTTTTTMTTTTSRERQLVSMAATNQHQVGAQMGHEESAHGSRVPICTNCHQRIHGPYILAGDTTWCKACSSSNFTCATCRKSLLNVGFIELTDGDGDHGAGRRYHCEMCFDTYSAPICSKCNAKIRADCLNALGKRWHPTCFVCQHCRQPFGNSSFYLEDNKPYCQRDWNLLFTSKCFSCSYPIEAGHKWIEALDRNYHSQCFRCSSCQCKLEGSTFYCKAGKPYCRLHAK